ncbi:hypothetical protein [Cochlodiniinecator piscidefendens]|uniref:hypothetical protein n=1 Tax=Cochlodiniinecator piscidefendens TaxID=2715756 RepID=UPI00140A582B|nr:hypothetical protein [Cochlodiniinecator piscidefendens]
MVNRVFLVCALTALVSACSSHNEFGVPVSESTYLMLTNQPGNIARETLYGLPAPSITSTQPVLETYPVQ